MDTTLFQYCQKIVIFNKDGTSVLLAKRRGEADYDGIFSFIGGKLESTDGGLVQGLQREKNEEIGPAARIAVVTGISLNEYFIKSNGQAMVLPHYYARFLGGEITINEEYSEYKWIAVNEIDDFEPKIETVSRIVRSIQKIEKIAAREDYLEL
jgi:NUDIX domain